jgi:hypothetical protein
MSQQQHPFTSGQYGSQPPQPPMQGSPQGGASQQQQGTSHEYANENTQQSDQSQPESKEGNLNPSVKFYKPRRNFNAQDPKTAGSALQIDLAIRKAQGQSKALACCFLNMASQSAAPGTQGGVFNWKGKLSFKLGRPDITKLLTVNNLWSGGVELIHKSSTAQGEKTTYLSYNMVGSMQDQNKFAWFIQQKTDGKISPYAVQARLFQQPSNIAMAMILQPEDVIEIGEFLKFSLWKIFTSDK